MTPTKDLPQREKMKSKFFIFVNLWSIMIVGIWYTYTQAIEFSAFAFGFAAGVIGVTMVYLIDLLLIPEFDTFLEIKNGNTAAAIYLLGICIVVGLGFLAAR
jgi:uncharacterized membrane protein YjfL (UPF0719 family)